MVSQRYLYEEDITSMKLYLKNERTENISTKKKMEIWR